MKNNFKNNTVFILLVFLSLISLIATVFIYPKLPEQIPIHWGINGNIDNYGNKNWIFIFDLIPIAIPVLMSITRKIDPKRANYKDFNMIYEGFAIGITLVMILLVWLTIGASFNILNLRSDENVPRIICMVLGILIIIYGNYSPKVKQNWFFGIKTPWTLNNKSIWQKTQRMGGFFFVFLGFLLVLCGIFFNPVMFISFFIVSVLGIFFLFGYSYWLFTKEPKQS